MKKLKVISCGMDKKADVHLVKILKKGENSIIKIKLKNQILNLKIKELNIHNILFSLLC